MFVCNTCVCRKRNNKCTTTTCMNAKNIIHNTRASALAVFFLMSTHARDRFNYVLRWHSCDGVGRRACMHACMRPSSNYVRVHVIMARFCWCVCVQQYGDHNTFKRRDARTRNNHQPVFTISECVCKCVNFCNKSASQCARARVRNDFIGSMRSMVCANREECIRPLPPPDICSRSCTSTRP